MKEKKLNCMRCKHDWLQRGKKKPKKCPCCNNPNWNKVDVKDFTHLILG